MSYLQAGAMYPFEITGGNLLPDPPYQGYHQIAQELLTSNSARGMIEGDLNFHYNASVIKSFIETPPFGKTLCTAFWKNTLGQECSIALVNATVGCITVIIKNITLNTEIFNVEQNISPMCQWIIDDTADNIKDVYIGITKGMIIPETPDDPKYNSVAVWQGRQNVENTKPYIYGRLGQFIADSEGTAEEIIAYNMFAKMGVDDPDTGNHSEASPPGSGLFMYEDHSIDFPDIPVLSAFETGFIGLYKLTAENVGNLGRYLWSRNFFDGIIKNFSSPFENIIALNILPINIIGTSDTVKIGNLDSGVNAQKLSGQFLDMNFGSIRIPKIFGNQMDFSPATDCTIYLPYIGYKSIDLDDASGGTLTLKYRVDLLSGCVLAMLRITQTDRYDHDSVEYFFEGNCAVHLPISGADYNQMYAQIISGAISAGVGLATGNPLSLISGASSILTAKPKYERSGGISGSPGYLGIQDAFILLNSPISDVAGNIKKLEGLRSNVYTSFANLSGFQKVEEMHPNSTLTMECTEEELKEIEELLKGGVIF